VISRFFSAIAARLRSVRYFLGDLFYLVKRPFRGIGQRIAPVWESIPPQWRLRGAVAAGAAGLILVAAFVVVPNLPCGAPGGDECAPDDDALAIVPGDALAYVHVNVDAASDQAEEAATVAERTPLLAKQVLGRAIPFLLGGAGEAPNFSEDIEPWFGGEIAIAVVPGESGTQQVQMLEVEDTKGAREYESSIGAGQPEPQDYQGTDLREDERGLATAIVGDFLVIGSADGVRSVIDVFAEAEGAESLSADTTAEQAIGELPSDSFAQAYLSAEGIDSFLALSDGALGPFEPLVDSGDSQGAAFAVGADEGGFRFATRSVLDPDRNPKAGGFFAAFEPFQPALPAELAPDTLAYVGFGSADETVSSLLTQATIRAPGIATGVTKLIDRLRKDAGVDLAEELLPALNGEGAIAVAPRPDVTAASAEEPSEDEVPDDLQVPGAPETVQGGQSDAPYLEFLADDVDEEAAADALARLQSQLAGSVDPSISNPVFREEAFGDVTAQVLQRSPADVLAYAIFEQQLVIADDTAPIERLDGDPDSGLAGSEAYEPATEGLSEEPSLIAYLDLSGLVATAERLGAGAEGPFATFAEDLRRLQTFAITVGTEEDVLSSDARLRISAP
jgi:hypothetical protein